MLSKDIIQNVLLKQEDLRDKLFCRGYVLTDSAINENKYPFYGLWSKTIIDGYTLLVSPKQHSYVIPEYKVLGCWLATHIILLLWIATK